MLFFSTPWKYQKTLRFSDVLGGGVEKGCTGNEWIQFSVTWNEWKYMFLINVEMNV